MTNTLLTLRKKIPETLTEILHSVFDISAELDIQTFVIGAIARDLIFEYVYEAKIRRATEDIDFGVAVGSWAEYEQLRESLIATGKFKDDKAGQRLWWKSGADKMKIDLVPYGGLESAEGEIAFPPDEDFVMNTNGFAEAFGNSIFLEIEKDFTVRIASLAGLALLKFIAYNDRPYARKRDVQDIWFIAQNYLEAGNEERLYEENTDLLDDDFDYRTCGARLLGRDISPLLNQETKEIILQILSDEKDIGRLQKFADVIYQDGLQDEDNYNQILEVLRQLRLGITE
ncbi:MAG: nucleotidyl transferase AbiEii/AbiGii toxin family protein [Aridibacter sp.]